MSLLERVRDTARSRLLAGLPGVRRLGPESEGTQARPQPAPVPARWRVAGWGAGAAVSSWLGVLAVVLIAWMLTPAGDADAGQLVGLSAGLWLLGTGAPIEVPTPTGPVTVGVVPLLVFGLSLWLAVRSLARARLADPDQSVPALVRRFGGGYAAALAVLTLLTFGGPVRPSWVGLVTALLVPALALLHDVLRDPPESLARRLPGWLERAWRPAAYGLNTLAAAGLVLVTAGVLVRWETVTGLYAAAGATGVSAVLLTLGQAPFLPNIVLWAVAFLTGPGFQIGAGGEVTVTGATPGLLPLVPVLGALPAAGEFPAWVRLGLLLPVAAGAVIGRSARRRWVRLAHWSGPARTAAAAVVIDAAAVLVITQLGAGPLGVERLAHVGPDPWLLAGALLVELALGAALWLAGTSLLARVRPQARGGER